MSPSITSILQPGTRTSLRDVAAVLGVSEADALRRLLDARRAGLVEAHPRGGWMLPRGTRRER